MLRHRLRTKLEKFGEGQQQRRQAGESVSHLKSEGLTRRAQLRLQCTAATTAALTTNLADKLGEARVQRLQLNVHCTLCELLSCARRPAMSETSERGEMGERRA